MPTARPMLAVQQTPDFAVLWDKGFFPLLCSYKMDGIRGWNRGVQVVSRSNKPFPSDFIQRSFAPYVGFDGEFIAGEPNGPQVRLSTHSACMTKGTTVPVDWYVFDYCPDDSWQRVPYVERRLWLTSYFRDQRKLEPREQTLAYRFGHLRLMEEFVAKDPEQLADLEAKALALNYEGLIARNGVAWYKYGRSTIGNSQYEGGLIKIKRTHDFEARIVGFDELMHNGNEQRENLVGTTSRSTHLANLVPGNTLGAIRAQGVNGPFEGREFGVGVFKGLSKPELKEIWDDRDRYSGRVFTYSCLMHGVKDLPVHPRWISWRDDLGEM